MVVKFEVADSVGGLVFHEDDECSCMAALQGILSAKAGQLLGGAIQAASSFFSIGSSQLGTAFLPPHKLWCNSSAIPPPGREGHET